MPSSNDNMWAPQKCFLETEWEQFKDKGRLLVRKEGAVETLQKEVVPLTFMYYFSLGLKKKYLIKCLNKQV